MPIYLYQNPNTKEIIEIIQSMNDTHEYKENGIKFDRIWSKPQASFDTKIDPHSAQDFVKKTGQKRGTVGDLWNTSAELAEKRGTPDDKYNNWSKNRGGRKHPEIVKRELKEEVSKQGFELTDD